MLSQLIAILAQLEQSYRTLKSQLDQLETTTRIAKEAARGLPDARSFGEISGLIESATSQYRAIRFQADGIKYEYQGIRSQFDALFPDARRIPAGDLRARQGEWYRETSSSARNAMAGQSLMQNTDATARNVGHLVGLSNSSTSQMQQLQVMNQLLATLSAQVADLTRMLATSNRAVSTQIAAQSAQQQVALEQERQLWDQRSFRAPPASRNVRTRLPKAGTK